MKPSGNLIADTICRTAELGLMITGAADGGDVTIIDAVAVDPINECPVCTQPGVKRDHVIRELVDLPVVGFPTRLRVRLPRYLCVNQACSRRIFQAGLDCAFDGEKTTRRVTRWILQRLAIDRMSVRAVAKALRIGWDLCCQLALDQAHELIYNDPDHLAGVRVIGVDEHKWSHNRKAHGDGFVTVIVDMTNKPARLLDVVKGRSSQALQSWLNQRDHSFRDRIEVVSMDGFTGYASAADAAVPKATRVMDPFHVVRLAGDKVTKCRQRLQIQTTGRRGRRGDPLYKNRKTMLTRDSLLTDAQKARLDYLWAFDEDYQPLYQAYLVYQRVIDCYEMKNRRQAKKAMSHLIDELRVMKGKACKEIAQLGRSLHKRRRDILAFFDRGVSNGPVEAINGRLEHLRGIALGFKNLNHYILRCLIHSGGLTNKINAL